MSGFVEHTLKILLGIGLLLGGFIVAAMWGINTTTGQITNVVFLGIGIILGIGGIVALKRL